MAGPLREGNLEEAIRIAERNSKSHIAKVTASGLAEFQLTGPRRDSNKTMEAIQRTLGRSSAIVHAELERGLASKTVFVIDAICDHTVPNYDFAASLEAMKAMV